MAWAKVRLTGEQFEIPPGWRQLESGDVIREGDMYLDMHDHVWTKMDADDIGAGVSRYGAVIRRVEQ